MNYEHLNYDITTILNVPFAPFSDGVNRDIKVTDNLTIGEIYDATLVIDKSKLLEFGIPFPVNGPAVHTLLRSYTKKPIYLGSAYRSYEWEIYKNRDGTSQHCYAAIDLNGDGLDELIEIALQQKNELYHELRRLGVNAFGQYNWGWHLDFRKNKADNSIYYWSEKKVETQNKSGSLFFLLPLLFIALKNLIK